MPAALLMFSTQPPFCLMYRVSRCGCDAVSRWLSCLHISSHLFPLLSCSPLGPSLVFILISSRLVAIAIHDALHVLMVIPWSLALDPPSHAVSHTFARSLHPHCCSPVLQSASQPISSPQPASLSNRSHSVSQSLFGSRFVLLLFMRHVLLCCLYAGRILAPIGRQGSQTDAERKRT